MEDYMVNNANIVAPAPAERLVASVLITASANVAVSVAKGAVKIVKEKIVSMREQLAEAMSNPGTIDYDKFLIEGTIKGTVKDFNILQKTISKDFLSAPSLATLSSIVTNRVIDGLFGDRLGYMPTEAVKFAANMAVASFVFGAAAGPAAVHYLTSRGISWLLG